MLTFVARSDIVIDPFPEFLPMEVRRNQFSGFFLPEVSGYLGVLTLFRDLG